MNYEICPKRLQKRPNAKAYFSFLIFIYMKSLFLLIINIFISLKVNYQQSHFFVIFYGIIKRLRCVCNLNYYIQETNLCYILRSLRNTFSQKLLFQKQTISKLQKQTLDSGVLFLKGTLMQIWKSANTFVFV